MDYFKNTETRVRRTSTGITELHDGYLSNSIVNIPVTEGSKQSKSIIAKTAKQKEELEKKVQDKRKQINKQFSNAKLEMAAKKAKFDKKLGEMHSKGKKAIFKRLVTEMYIESLYLDESFILENFENIANIVDTFIEENGGYSLLENAYLQSKSPLLKQMIDICESTTKKVNERVYKESAKTQDLDLLNFDLNHDEKEELDYQKRDLGIDEISAIVKEKVLKVVKDEKAREKKHEELKNDIEQELSENPDVVDEKSVKENLARMFTQVSPTEEGTLFNALLRSNYKNILEGNSTLFTNEFGITIENSLLDDLDIDEADLEDENDEFEEEDLIQDEEMFEIFDASAQDIVNNLSHDEDSSEELEEAFSDIKNKVKSCVKNIKSCKRAKKVKKDIRKIQKSTEELEEKCNSKSTSTCKKKAAVESFIDMLDDCVEELDNIIELHESVMVEVNEAMRTSKGGKNFVNPIMKLNDIKLPDVKFMYKVKAVEKEVNKLVKSSNNKNVATNTKKIIDKNISNINSMIEKLKKSVEKSASNKLKALEGLKSKLQNKLSSVKESIEYLEESILVEEHESIDIELLEEGNVTDQVKSTLVEIAKFLKDIPGLDIHKAVFKMNVVNIKFIKAAVKIKKSPNKSNISEAIKLCDELIKQSENVIKTYNSNRVQAKPLKEFNEKNYRETIEKLKAIKKDLISLKSTIIESFEIEFDEEEFIDDVYENTIDMDMILAQTIANYTLMEMCYTIKLTNYRTQDIKKMSHDMLNK